MKEFFKPSSKPAEKEAPKDPSKRRFMKTLLGAGAAALTHSPMEALARLVDIQRTENIENKSLDQGVLEMHTHACTRNHEQYRVYFEADHQFNNNGRMTNYGWYRPQKVEEQESQVQIPREIQEVLMSDPDDLKKIRTLHSHPLQDANERLSLMEDDLRKRIHRPETQPQFYSQTDIFGYLENLINYPKLEGKLNDELIEPSGHWSASVNPQHPVMKNIIVQSKAAIMKHRKMSLHEFQQAVNTFRKEHAHDLTPAGMKKLERISDTEFSKLCLQVKEPDSEVSRFLSYILAVNDILFSTPTDELEKTINYYINKTRNDYGLQLTYRPIQFNGRYSSFSQQPMIAEKPSTPTQPTVTASGGKHPSAPLDKPRQYSSSDTPAPRVDQTRQFADGKGPQPPLKGPRQFGQGSRPVTLDTVEPVRPRTPFRPTPPNKR